MKKRGNPGGCKCCTTAPTAPCTGGNVVVTLSLTDDNGTFALVRRTLPNGVQCNFWTLSYPLTVPGWTVDDAGNCVAGTVTTRIGYVLECPGTTGNPANANKFLLYQQWAVVTRGGTCTACGPGAPDFGFTNAAAVPDTSCFVTSNTGGVPGICSGNTLPVVVIPAHNTHRSIDVNVPFRQSFSQVTLPPFTPLALSFTSWAGVTPGAPATAPGPVGDTVTVSS
jgi:hypothetical protein